MQRTTLPPKGKLFEAIQEISEKPFVKAQWNGNNFYLSSYRRFPWLFCTFGAKDGSTDERYFRLKAEISAFASELNRLYTNSQNPKYRSVYGLTSSNDYELKGFITKKLSDPISLVQVFEDIRLQVYTLLPRLTRYDQFELNQIEQKITRWYDETIKYIENKLSNLKWLMSEDKHTRLKQMFIDFLTTLKNKMQAQAMDDCEKIDKFACKKLQEFYDESLQLFEEEIKESLKNKLIKRIPQFMALSYILGEANFKAQDIICDKISGDIYKLDFERCLSGISHLFMMDCDNKHIASVIEELLDKHSISSEDIDEFPKRTYTPMYWPTENVYDYPKWFHDMLSEDEFKRNVYICFLAFVVTPKHSLRQLGELFFTTTQNSKITDYLIQRRKYLKKALMHSERFGEFLNGIQPEDVLAFFAAHNSRWHKEKYQAIWLDIEDIKQRLVYFKQQYASRKDKIDSNINHVYFINPPRLS